MEHQRVVVSDGFPNRFADRDVFTPGPQDNLVGVPSALLERDRLLGIGLRMRK